MKRSLALLFACFALGLVIAGCGGDGDSGNAEPESQPAPKAEGEGGGATVSMENIQFNPGELTIKVGDSVTWTNDDTVGHDVTGDGFTSGDPGGLENGDTFQHTFDKAGTFDYVCKAHAGMKGTVLVQ
jgi:plastocyanin